MKRCDLYFISLLLFCSIGFSQTKQETKTTETKKPKTADLGIGAGLAGSSVFLAQNVKEKNSALGYYGTLTYGRSDKPYRASFEYTHYRNINIAPTWLNVKASSAEANLHAIWRFHKVKSYLFLISGVSYNVFSGYFTGKNDFLNLASEFPLEQSVSKKWWGFNAGLGYELYYKNLCGFITYKMRVGMVKDSELNIMDVCISGGVRYNVTMTPIGLALKKIFRGTRNRYYLNT